jgi:hypothetical protein
MVISIRERELVRVCGGLGGGQPDERMGRTAILDVMRQRCTVTRNCYNKFGRDGSLGMNREWPILRDSVFEEGIVASPIVAHKNSEDI